jgi:two-component system sensor histidine kinase KdpD
MSEPGRDPDALLSRLKREELESRRGKLKVFFGAVAGVGKTYSMLEAAQKLKEQNIDVVVGYVETHSRRETEALLDGLPTLPPRLLEYRGAKLKEFDIDAALERKPEVILVDELAHTNAPDSRHPKRWQDVLELLEAGIDVYTTLNVQHVESLHDIVAQITKISIRERVPDSLLEKASEIELVDLPPEELLQRLKDGKVYVPEQARSALANFFRKGNLIALRELALRYTADRVVADMEEYRQVHAIKHPWPAAERLLVCVSPSPLSARLVRSGKRMAEAFNAKWTVIYVEGRRAVPLPPDEKNRVLETLRLAEQLGAETLQLPASNVADEIVKCAGQYNASKIIIGKPLRPRWKELLFGSVVDEVIRLSGAIDVYVISGEGDSIRSRSPERLVRSSKSSAYAMAIAVVVLCTGLASLMRSYFEASNIIMCYLLGIVLVATRCGRGPSIMASVLAVAAFDFFYVPPYFTFAVADTQYLVTFTVMLIVALVISNLTVTIRQQADAARIRETRTAALYSMSRELSSTLDMNSLVKIGLRHISDVFDSQVALFVTAADGQLESATVGEGKQALTDADPGISGWVHLNKQSAGLGTDTLPGAEVLYVPLLGATKAVGVLAVRPSAKDRFLPPEQVHLLETFANQIAIVCERAQLSDDKEQARLQVKTEQMRSSLLSAVSHDLRTPLATITGAASGIVEGTEALDLGSCKEMAREIYQESIRLDRLVANLLDITKLQSGSLQVLRELHPVDELVGAALNCLDKRTSSRPVRTHVPEDLPLVSVDPILIQQVLVNLIENALKYTPAESEIEVSAEDSDGTVTIGVADRGPGIADDRKGKIFEMFYREHPHCSAGAGLGLAICNGIVEAHGGKIWVEDRPGGGAQFKFTLQSGGNLPGFPGDEDAASDEVDHVRD